MVSLEQILEELGELGLTIPQARVYFATFCLGSATARQIANHCSIDQSVAYRRLNELAKLDLIREELGTPNTYVARDLERSLERLLTRAKAQLVLKVQAADRLEEELQKLRASLNDPESIAKPSSASYRLVRGRGQVLREAVRCCKGAQREVLLLLPSRGVTRMVNSDYIDWIRESAGRGVKIRVVAEVSDGNRGDLEVLAETVDLRMCDYLPLRFGIFDKKKAYVGAIRDSDTAPDDADEPYLVLGDSAFAAGLCFFFEAVWSQALPFDLDPRKAPPPAEVLA